RCYRDWSSDVCSSDLGGAFPTDDRGPDSVGTGTGKGPPLEKKTRFTGVLASTPGPHTAPREHLHLLAFPGADRAPRRPSQAGRTGVGLRLRERRSGHAPSPPAALPPAREARPEASPAALSRA